MELDLLFADDEVAVVHFLRDGVEAGIEVEVDQRPLLVLEFVERGRFLKMPTKIGELVVAPDLLKSKCLRLRSVPGVIKMEAGWILAAILLDFRFFDLELCL